ncbi:MULTISPECIES: PIN domain-containing protein [Protofrankia]|uniref:PilT protein domain protein n=1 Tax=Candidatus Protofrankia datiscae TaxID=2716812 RepID=F8AXD0_9ACTN|nr:MULTISPECIES: PIN domain-containing protein [Protofrankia]AEH09410.1 PilT protein domain protein [Candidatus Protofrankia datiscae]
MILRIPCEHSADQPAALRRPRLPERTSGIPAGNRRTHLAAWLDADLVPRFADRILTVDIPIADAWGMLMADGDRNGRPAPVIDSFLAATATAHDLTLATRNTRDFTHLGIPLINP